MTADAYLQSILTREAVDTSIFSPVRNVQNVLYPLIGQWAGIHLISVSPSGSFAKGTANKSGTDIDLFISLSPQTTEALKEIYSKLFNYMGYHKYTPKRQNVSINIRVLGHSVDLVPAKRQDNYSNDHSLYRRRADSWTKTNVMKHISHVSLSGLVGEIRIIKLWRDQKRLDFPSFYLELSVIKALAGNRGSLSENVWESLKYFRDNFMNTIVVDPANSNNIISGELTALERAKVKAAAEQALKAANWNQVVV